MKVIRGSENRGFATPLVMSKLNTVEEHFPFYVWIILPIVLFIFVAAVIFILNNLKRRRGQFSHSPLIYSVQPPYVGPGISYQSYPPGSLANSGNSLATASYSCSPPYPRPYSGATPAKSCGLNIPAYTSSYPCSPPVAASTVESGTSVIPPDNFYAIGSNANGGSVPIN